MRECGNANLLPQMLKSICDCTDGARPQSCRVERNCAPADFPSAAWHPSGPLPVLWRLIYAHCAGSNWTSLWLPLVSETAARRIAAPAPSCGQGPLRPTCSHPRRPAETNAILESLD